MPDEEMAPIVPRTGNKYVDAANGVTPKRDDDRPGITTDSLEPEEKHRGFGKTKAG